jgi:hypothetical protein
MKLPILPCIATFTLLVVIVYAYAASPSSAKSSGVAYLLGK